MFLLYVPIVAKLIVNIEKRENAPALAAALRRKVAEDHCGEQHALNHDSVLHR